MKKCIALIISFSSLLACHHASVKNNSIKLSTVKVAAPFKMPAITIPDFSKCSKFLITDYGALPADKENTSKAIAIAIEKAAVNGGVVVIPKGEWLTGKVHLKSNVNLHLEEGAILTFSDNPNDYLPVVHTTWEGMECYNYSPLVYAYNCTNVAITGKGELKAEMETWKKWFARPKAHMNSLKYLYDLAAKDIPVEQRQMVNDTANLRPQFIQFNRCQNVVMENVSVKNSPFWTVHVYLCKNVVVRKVNIFAHGHNNDGVDPEMSENVLIEDCIFDQGDDAISVKSGRDHDAWRLNTPARNIVIRNCLVKNGHQLIALGSELSGGIENVFIDNCKVVDGAKLNHLLFIKTNERRGGYVKNIYMQNVKSGKIDLGILGIETDVLYQWKDLMPTYKRVLTPISDIYLENVHATDVKFISRVLGQEELPVNNVVLKKVTANNVSDKQEIHVNLQNFKKEL